MEGWAVAELLWCGILGEEEGAGDDEDFRGVVGAESWLTSGIPAAMVPAPLRDGKTPEHTEIGTIRFIIRCHRPVHGRFCIAHSF